MNQKETGKRIKEARKFLKLTQKDFGAPMGLSYAAISQYEHGIVNEKNVRAIASRYSISMEWLLNGKGEMFAPPEGVDSEKAIEIAQKVLNLPPLAVEILRAYAELTDEEKERVKAAIQSLLKKKGQL